MSTDTEQPPERPSITHAEPPFDRADADIVLISSDHVHFRAHKAILAVASPVFDSMFSLPQPSPDEGDTSLPTVTMSEDAQTLYFILRTCYPVSRSPKIASLDDARLVLEMSRKYEIVPFEGLAEEALLDMADKDPIGVFVVACLYGLDSVAGHAAQASLNLSQVAITQSEHLHLITGHQFSQILQYHLRCGREALRALAAERGAVFKQLKNGNTRAVTLSNTNPCPACCTPDPNPLPQAQMPSMPVAFGVGKSQFWWASPFVWDRIAGPTSMELLLHPFLLGLLAPRITGSQGSLCSTCHRDAEACCEDVLNALSVAIENAVKQIPVPSFV